MTGRDKRRKARKQKEEAEAKQRRGLNPVAIIEQQVSAAGFKVDRASFDRAHRICEQLIVEKTIGTDKHT